MTNEQKQVRDWMSAFGQDTLTSPTIPSLEVRKLRAKLILEVALETILGLGFTDIGDGYGHIIDVEELLEVVTKCETLTWDEYPHLKPDLNKILDGCEDLKVVTEGCLVACGLVRDSYEKVFEDRTTNERVFVNTKEDPHFNEVMRSNWSKMWTQEEVGKLGGILLPFNEKLGEERQFSKGSETFYGKRLTLEKRCWLVKDSSGKVIKSPSYSPPQFKL